MTLSPIGCRTISTTRSALEERVRSRRICLTCADCRSVARGSRATSSPSARDRSRTARRLAISGPGIAARVSARRRAAVASRFPSAPVCAPVSFTLPQLAAATLAVMLLSGGLVWVARSGDPRADFESLSADAARTRDCGTTAGLTDTHYEAAVSDLEGHSRPDARASIPRPCGSSKRTWRRSIAPSTSPVARSTPILRTCI